jgi:hypothetical protein
MSITIHVNSAPSRPAYITGLTSGLCNRTNVTYCAPAVSGANSYQWSVPSGATIVSGQGTTCITVNFSGSLGSNSVCGYSAICVRAVNSCGMSQARCVNLYTAPTAIACINGPSTVNQNVTTTYSVSSVSGATSYNWIVPTGWTILSGQGTTSICVLTGANSGNVSVTPANACSAGTRVRKYVTIQHLCSRQAEGNQSTANRPNLRTAEVSETHITDAILYPNPANESFTIESGDALPSLVEVMDMTGMVVYTGSQIRRIESNSWTSGIYIVRLHFTTETQTKRIEIMH